MAGAAAHSGFEPPKHLELLEAGAAMVEMVRNPHHRPEVALAVDVALDDCQHVTTRRFRHGHDKGERSKARRDSR